MNKLCVAIAVLALLVVACDRDASTTDLTVAPSINPELAAHSEHFTPKVYKVGDIVYSAVGWNLANVIMIEGTDGIIIVDTGTNVAGGKAALAALRKITDKPVVAVVYTHFHPDHWGGVKAFASDSDVAAGRVRIFAHETMLANVMHQGGIIGPILAMRTGYSFGLMLTPEDRAGMNDGIGPAVRGSEPGSFIAPTDGFADRLEVTVAGVRLQMIHVPSEAPDEIAVYLPDHNILLSGETIQGPTLPNIHTLRGSKFRDPLQWYRSIDVLRGFGADYLVPAHGQPLYGAAKVEEVLRMTRDAIQFIHDQTVRLMNRGLTPDELARAVVLPPHLAGYKPYLREYYGTVKHAVRQIYSGYLGWFEGDPVDLDPVPREAASGRYVALMGGRDAVLAAARAAYRSGDFQWSAELATHLVRIDHGDDQARLLKAAALRQLGYASMNTNWRNWYLSAAMELEGKVEPLAALRRMTAIFASPDVIAQWPMARIVNGLAFRLKAEDSLKQQFIAGFRATGGGGEGALEVRRGVAQFHAVVPATADFTITGPKAALTGVVMGRLALADGVEKGLIQVAGDREAAARFMNLFDPVIQPIALTVR